MSGLRERCRAFCERERDAEDLVAFVVSEIGRTADRQLDSSYPLCLYFASEEERRDFVRIAREAKPTMVTKKVP